jgi:hypothetical protein
MTEYKDFEEFHEVTVNRDHLYLILGYGTGDTFNALIHLQKYPPSIPYSLIIKNPQKNLVRFILNIFAKKPLYVLSIKYWKHDFSVKIAQHFPTVTFARGFEVNSSRVGFIDLWLNPSNYQKIAPLNDQDIINIIEAFGKTKSNIKLAPNSTVLFITAGENFSQFVPNWRRIADVLTQCGLPDVYVNRSGVNEYGSEEIEGITPLDLNHSDLISLFYSQENINIVGVRSGVLDILRFSKQKALVLYQPKPSGIFETCRFGLLKNNLDLIEVICLPGEDKFQQSVIEYHLKSFIGFNL